MNNKVLLVTGASSDIGTALISRIAENYDKIIAHFSSNSAKVEGLQETYSKKIIPMQANLKDVKEINKFADKITEYSPTHFVHLPAVPVKLERFHKVEQAVFEQQFNVVLNSAIAVCKSIIPNMISKKFGKIVFMLSENARVNSPPQKNALAYTTAKYALFGFMKCLAAEYADKGIAVNGVSPSMIDTNFLASYPELARQMNANASPLKRNLTVDDVIPAIEFLLSPGADTISGQNIVIGV
jgi:3-oxoacyl-[acyl-carrier protein] reductase